MTKSGVLLMSAGIVVVGATVFLLVTKRTQTAPPKHPAPITHIVKTPHTSHKRATSPAQKRPQPPHSAVPVIPHAAHASASSASASLAAVTQKEGVTTPTGPIDYVKNLADPPQTWAFATKAAKGASTGYTLWFGEQDAPHGPWTWIPSTLPGALSSKLPPAVYSALQWAWDLNQGQPGPALLGAVSWAAVTGHVGIPEGWTAQESYGQLTITTWAPSYTGTYSGYYGVQSAWYAGTIAAGQSGLSMIVPGGNESLAQLVAQANT